MAQRLTAVLAPLVLAGALGAQEVTLPLDRYEELRKRAQPVPTVTPAPPAPYALESAQIEIVAGKETARVTERLTVSLFARDWQEIALPSAGSLTSAQLGALEGRVKTDAQLLLVVRGKGRHTIVLTSVVALAEDASAARVTRTLSLALPPAAAVAGNLSTTDEQIQEIVVASGGLARSTATARKLDFVGGAGATLSVRLLGPGRSVDRAKLPLKFTAVSTTLAEVARTRTKVTGWVSVDVLSGQLDKLTIDLPKDLEVVAVRPADVGWEIEGNKLVVTPAAAVEKALALVIELTGETKPAFASPLVVPVGAAQLTLLNAVRVADDGQPMMVDMASGRRAEPEDEALVVEAARGAGTAYFVVRDRTRTPRWEVEWPEKGKSLAAQIDRLLVNAVLGGAQRGAYECWAVVRSSGMTEISLRPPAGFEVLRVERDGIEVQPGATAAGLVVPLAAGSETQVVHVAGLLDSVAVPESGELALGMPSASAPIASIEVQVALPGDRQYSLAQEERRRGAGGIPRSRSVPGKETASGLQVLAARRAGRAQREWSPYAGSDGATTIEAGWSAMTETPGPLVIRIKPRRQKEVWF